MNTLDRREFLTAGGAILAGAALAGVATAQTPEGAAVDHAAMLRALIPGSVDANGAWTLPPLPYPVDALEPHLDKETMALHHDKHHAAYVKGLVAAEEGMAKMRESGDFADAEKWSAKASFHGAGHFLHCVFWDSMAPQAGGEPDGALAKAVARDFGGFGKFRAQFTAAATSVEGSGWGVLAYQLASNRLTVLQARNHQIQSQWGLVPLLCVDMWEHAYYLRFNNRRADYLEAWWNVVNWKAVGKRFGLLGGERT